MDFEKLGAAIPGAQQNIVRERDYRAGFEALTAPVAELEARIDVVLANLDVLYQNQCSPPSSEIHILGKAITLNRTEASTGPDGTARPAGVSVVVITPVQLASNAASTSPIYTELGSAAACDGYSLQFCFVADGDHRREELGEELTIATGVPDELEGAYDPYELSSQDRKKRVATHVLPPPRAQYGKENDPALLDTYKESYLEKRLEQIQELELSVAMIQAALKDPELNPWFAELQAALEAVASAETDNESAEQTEQHLPASEPDQPAEPRRPKRFRLRM